jgi:hypothetical protein
MVAWQQARAVAGPGRGAAAGLVRLAGGRRPWVAAATGQAGGVEGLRGILRTSNWSV